MGTDPNELDNLFDFIHKPRKIIKLPESQGPTPTRKFSKKRQRDESPYSPPDIMEMLSLPLPLPTLRKEIKKQNTMENVIEKEIDLLNKYRKKPLLFFRDELGLSIDIWRNDVPPKDWIPGDPVPIWSAQREIIEALVKHRKVAVKTGHGVGKTYIAGGLALYLAYAWHATGMTTAPTFRQVRRALWGEIHYLYNRAKNPLGGKLNQVSLDLGDKWFVEGFATDKPSENITGIHEENIFVIVDEGGGVLPETYEALDALLTSETSFVLYIGNPTAADGPFYDAFKPNSGFKTFTISCYDCPNVKHDRIIYSKLTAKKWVDDKVKKWGVASNLFRIRVAGEFAEESRDTLIPIKYIEIALRKGVEGEVVPDEINGFGLDVARQGSDSSVFGAKYNSGFFKVLESTQKQRETATAGKMKSYYDSLIPKFKYRSLDEMERKLKKDKGEEVGEDPSWPPINVDDIGVGGGVVDILVEDEYPVNGVNVAEAPDPSEPEEAKLFLNKRAQYYWRLKVLFEQEKVAIDDEDLAFELSKLKMEFLRSGKIKIIDKETLKKPAPQGMGKSPDKAECMMLAFAVESADVERELVRFL
jgi:phage terminase large subunit